MAAEKWRILLSHRFDPALRLPGAETDEMGLTPVESIDTSKIEAHLMIVKDHGAYMMSGGDPGWLKPDGSGHHVVFYARGCDPEKDAGYHDTTRRICGGDDFGEAIPCSDLIDIGLHSPHAKELTVRFVSEGMQFRIAI